MKNLIFSEIMLIKVRNIRCKTAKISTKDKDDTKVKWKNNILNTTTVNTTQSTQSTQSNNNNMKDKGTVNYKDGSKYEGELKNGIPNGQGIKYDSNSNISYEGGFKDNEYHGKGVCTFLDGTKYEGEWKNGQIDGEGKVRWPNGITYEGSFKDGKQEGKGSMTYTDGSKYIGKWKNDKMDEHGVFKRSKDLLLAIKGEKQKGSPESNISDVAILSILDTLKSTENLAKTDTERKTTKDAITVLEKRTETVKGSDELIGKLKTEPADQCLPIIITGGWKDHCITYVIEKKPGNPSNYNLCICNRGQGAQTIYEGTKNNKQEERCTPTVELNITENNLDTAIDLIKKAKKEDFVTAEKTVYKELCKLGENLKYKGKKKTQRVGNCWYQSPKQATSELLRILGEKYKDPNAALNVYKRSIGSTANRLRLQKEGVMTLDDGSKYLGEWKDGKKHGHGVNTDANGNVYDGEFINGKREGQGTLIHRNGQTYDGNWENGKINGKGILTWKDGRSYERLFRDGKIHGNGEHTWPDGSKYNGEWKDGKEHGQGVFKYSNGDKYDGNWEDGMRNGQGVMTLGGGKKLKGEFKKNKFIKGKQTHNEILVYEGEFLKGKPHGEGSKDHSNGKVKHNGNFVLH